jgi:hypothetical protein
MMAGVEGSNPLGRGLLDRDPTPPLNTVLCVGSRNGSLRVYGEDLSRTGCPPAS